MILKVSHDQALARRHRHVTKSGALTHIETYLGTNSMELASQGKSATDMGGQDGPYPMAFAVEQAPDSVVQPLKVRPLSIGECPDSRAHARGTYLPPC